MGDIVSIHECNNVIDKVAITFFSIGYLTCMIMVFIHYYFINYSKGYKKTKKYNYS